MQERDDTLDRRAVGNAETIDAELVCGRQGTTIPASLGPKFQILDLLGRGAMGVVLRVRHTELDKVMAVKLMSGGQLSRAASVRLWREARAASDLDHPNIVRVHDLDRAPDGTPFIVMELLDGHTLEEELRRSGPLAPARVVTLLSGVADALDAAHARGVVHRDLKPLNLFVTRDRVVKILDFGICHYEVGDEARATRAGHVVGTPLYMAPEQLRGEPPVAQTDLYAFACIVWQALTGRPPFGGLTFDELMERPRPPIPPRLESVAPQLPTALGDVLERALAPEPADRWPSARAFLQAFERAAGVGAAGPTGPRLVVGDTGPARQPAAQDTATRPSPERRLRTLRLVWPFALLAVLLVAGLWLLPGRPPRPDGVPAAGSAAGVPPTPAAAVTPRWPAEVRLLVLPFTPTAPPTRTVDDQLWPLVDRLVVNALAGDERLHGRLRRVDPAAVAAEIERRELGPTFDDAAILELAAALQANTVLVGQVGRAQGFVHLDGSLRVVGSPGESRLQARHVHLLDAARALAGEARRTIWGDPAPALTPARLSQLLVSTPSAAAALGSMEAHDSLEERAAAWERARAADPGAAGLAWLHYLDNVTDPLRRTALADHALATDDPELRAFLAAVARGEHVTACADVDAAAVGARYPLLLGPLAEAVCAYLRGDWSDALRLAGRAYDDVTLRAVALPFLLKLQYLTRTCDEALPQLRRVQSLSPEFVVGWSALAHWYVRCDRLDEARDALRIARALLRDDSATARRVAYNGAWVQLAALDVEGAREWLDLLDRTRDPAVPEGGEYFVRSLALHLQGRPEEARAVLADGLDAFRPLRDNTYTMLAASLLYSELAANRPAAARRLAEEFGAAFGDPADAGNHYMAQMLDLAVQRAEGRIDERALERRVAALGAAVEAALGDLGRDERHAQECMLATYLGLTGRAERVLEAARPGNSFLGGCRLRRAERLLADGRAAEAAEEYDRALRDILWARFIYADFLGAALLGRARALEAAGRAADARGDYERLVRNFARSERVLPEYVAATEALARLGGQPSL